MANKMNDNSWSRVLVFGGRKGEIDGRLGERQLL